MSDRVLTSASSARPRLAPAIITAAAAGGVAGAIASWLYYTDLRPLSHILGPWVLLAVIVSAGQRLQLSILRCCASLVSAVLTFYFGKELFYWLKYSDLYTLNWIELGSWGVLGAAAGLALGATFHHLGKPTWLGASATSAALGLLVADYYRRVDRFGSSEQIVPGFIAVAIVLVLVLARPTYRQAFRLIILLAPFTALGYLVVSFPDYAQQLLYGVR